MGFDRNLTHLDGHVVRLVRKGVTQPGTSTRVSVEPSDTHEYSGYVQTIKGEGMPIFEQSGHGDLFVEYNVVLPVELNANLRRSKPDFFPASPVVVVLNVTVR